MKQQNICWICGRRLIEDLRRNRWWIPAEVTDSRNEGESINTRLHFCSERCGLVYLGDEEDRAIGDRLREGFFMMSDEFEDDPNLLAWYVEDPFEDPLFVIGVHKDVQP